MSETLHQSRSYTRGSTRSHVNAADQKLVEYWIIRDDLTVMRQLGVI